MIHYLLKRRDNACKGAGRAGERKNISPLQDSALKSGFAAVLGSLRGLHAEEVLGPPVTCKIAPEGGVKRCGPF
jgi:hypothetical protein